MNIIIVTGASSGMGREFVKQIDVHFPKVDEIWLVARRKDRLLQVAAGCHHKCRVMALDLLNESDMLQFASSLNRYAPNIRLLINSAGFGILGQFKELPLKEQIDMIQLNCMALTKLTYLSLPFMERGSRVIQLASSAAFFPQSGFAVYAATKSYVLSLSRALSEELRKDGIIVTSVCPGPVETEFFDRAEQGQGTLAIKKYVMAKPEQVVAQALRDSRNKKTVSIYGWPIKLLYLVSKTVPQPLYFFILRHLK